MAESFHQIGNATVCADVHVCARLFVTLQTCPWKINITICQLHMFPKWWTSKKYNRNDYSAFGSPALCACLQWSLIKTLVGCLDSAGKRVCLLKRVSSEFLSSFSLSSALLCSHVPYFNSYCSVYSLSTNRVAC